MEPDAVEAARDPASANNERPPVHSAQDSGAQLVQLHAAEYAALTMRSTYWITLQYALWPILLLSLTLIAQTKDILSREAMIWAAASVIQVSFVHYYAALYESYNNARYIERELKPLVAEVVDENRFWLYELYVNRKRGLNPGWWELWPVALSIGTVGLAWWASAPWSALSYVAVALNAICTVLSVTIAAKSIRTRKEFVELANSTLQRPGARVARSGR